MNKEYTVYKISKSYKLQKQIVIKYQTLKYISKYKKYLRQRKKLLVHYDLEKVPKIGDIVKIIRVKPISKHKHFKVIEIMEQ